MFPELIEVKQDEVMLNESANKTARVENVQLELLQRGRWHRNEHKWGKWGRTITIDNSR